MVESMVNEAINLDPSYFNQNKIAQIKEFTSSTINGDSPISYLTVYANLDNKKQGIVIYILTNLRFIKIGINKEIKSNSYPINTITGIERSLLEDDRAQFGILPN